MKSKRFKNLLKLEKDITSKSIKELLPSIKKNCTTKFDESIDLSLQINNKQKKGEVNIRTVVNMPAGTGKVQDNAKQKKYPVRIPSANVVRRASPNKTTYHVKSTDHHYVSCGEGSVHNMG